MSLLKKTHRCKVIPLINTKQVALLQEYDNLQHYLQTREGRGIYSANKQQADRFYKIIEKTTNWYGLIFHLVTESLLPLFHLDSSTLGQYQESELT
jgi:hypothetical protein